MSEMLLKEQLLSGIYTFHDDEKECKMSKETIKTYLKPLFEWSKSPIHAHLIGHCKEYQKLNITEVRSIIFS